MNHSIWMHPWDLAGWAPEEFLTHLRGLGLDGCNLALHYHATRLLLPCNRRFTIYEDPRGGAHYAPDPARWLNHRLRPQASEHAAEAGRFLRACERAGFPVHAWTVLCHTDCLGETAPECCIENACGDRYPYALCPANPDVAEYCATVCAEIAAQPAVASLDLEAASFMGYTHGSTHERAAVALPAGMRWLLSLCFCPHCMKAYGPTAQPLRAQVRSAIGEFLAQPRASAAAEDLLGAEQVAEVCRVRRALVAGLLLRIRHAVPRALLNLRLSTDPLFSGGKAALEWADLPGLADAATLTFFGSTPETMDRELANVPRPAPAPLTVGFMLCPPDTESAADFRARCEAAKACQPRQINFYALGLATRSDLERLRRR